VFELEEDVVLAREVEVERASNHSGGAGDPVDLGRSHTAFTKFREGGLEEALARVSALLRPPTRRRFGACG
jgi:hypothetical protein